MRMLIKALALFIFSLSLSLESSAKIFGEIEGFHRVQSASHQHPLTHKDQYYIVPSDSENGDNVGKVYELWTDRRFNDRSGQDYTFEIVGGNTNDAFSIESNTGELLVKNAKGISSNTILSVKVSIGTDSQLSNIHIKRVDNKDIVYIDSQFSGTSNGSRSAPFKSFKNSGLGNGTAGKYYLFRRGRTYNNDMLVIYNGENSARITIGAWGSGERPLLDGNNNNNRSIQLGSIFNSTDDINKTAFNVDVMDLQFRRYQSHTIAVSRRGKNFNFRRLKMGETTSVNGLIWLARQADGNEVYPSNIYGSDLELYGFTDRGMKVERGGEASNPVLFENIKAYNGGSEGYVSATDHPYVTLRYLDIEANGSTGPNIRYGQHNLEWAYLKGLSRAIFLWKRDDTQVNVTGAHIRDVIIDGTTTGDGIHFEKHTDASKAHENIVIERVEIRNAGRHGINLQQEAKNVKISYLLIYGSGSNGIRVDGTTSGIQIHNSIIIDNSSSDISAGSNTDVKNSIYQSKSGSFKEEKNTSETGYFENRQQKNYRPKSDAPYLNKGSVLGYKFDLDGNEVPANPTLGSYESEMISESNIFPTVSITSPKENDQFIQGDNISITANAADTDGTIAKVEFFNGTTLLGTDNTSPYSFTWANLPVGSYALTAKATDDKGVATVSAVVNIKVVEKANVAPSVSITSPKENDQFIQGDNISITADAADTDGTIAKVEFFNGTTLLGTDNTSPYSFEWKNLPVGSYSLTAKATDDKGAATVSAVVNIKVVEKANSAPTVSITSPKENDQFIQGDNISITADAADTDGTIAKVEFFNGTTLLGTDNTSPYSFTWANLPVGSYSLTAKATDDKGAATVSAAVNIKVVEKANAAPAVSITSPTQNASFEEGVKIEITADALDTDGNVNKVEFYNGDILLGTSASAPYSFNWSDVAAGSYTLTAKAFDDKDASAVSEEININILKDNVAPTVVLTSPVQDASYEEGSNIEMIAEAADTDGTIAKVEFFNDTTLLGMDNTYPYSFDWMNLPVGSYSLTAKATDDKGAATVSAVVNIKVVEKANAAPTVSITSPKENDQFIQGDNISITANAADTDGTIAKVEFFNGTTLLGTDNTSPYSFTWANLPVGSYALTAKATDDKGAATVSAAVNIKVVEKANAAPSVSISSPKENDQFIQGDNISITADAADTDGTIAKVEFFNGTTLLGTDNTSPYSFDWKNLPVGSYSLTAKATDDKGAATVSAVVNIKVVEKANAAPAVSITSPTQNASFEEGVKIEITADALDTDGNVNKVEFYNGDILLGTSASAPYTFIWSDVAAGSYTLTAKAFDDKDASAVSGEININILKDNVAPTVVLTSPVQDASYEEGSNIEMIADAADTDGTIAKVEFYSGTTLLGTDNTSPYSFNWSNLPVGSYSLTAKATDDKGAATVSAVVNIKVVEKANAAPTVSITSPKENDQFVQGDNISITANAADTDGTIAKVEFFNDTTLLGTDNTSPYSFTWANLPVGSYALTAKATDDKGAATVSAAVNIKVVEKANAAPTVSITSPKENDQFVQGDNISITANAADTDGTIAKVELFNDTTLLGTDNTSPYSFAWTNLPVGSYSLTAKATDDKGAATVSAAVNIKVVEKANAAPAVSITSPTQNASFEEGVKIEITADALDTDGNVNKVEFYNGDILLGTSASAPYTFIWSDVAAGSYTLTAKAFDDKDASAVSGEININILKDNVAPTVVLTSPVQDASYEEGSNIEMIADAADTDGTIAKVEFYSGTVLLGTITEAPLTFTWNNVAIGSYTLTVKVYDDKGAATVSQEVKINVISKKIAPQIRFISPQSNTEFFRYEDVAFKVEIEAPNSEIVKVEYFRNDISIGHNDKAPFDFVWNAENIGNSNFTAVATDMDGDTATSEILTIKVKNNAAPTVNIITPQNEAHFDADANIQLAVEASDSDGKVVKVEFYSNEELIGESVEEPFNFTWNNVSAGNYKIIAKAYDNRNSSSISSAVNVIVEESPKSTETVEVVLPEIIIVTPVNNQEFESGEEVNLMVMFQGSEEPVRKVEYYSGSQLIGSSVVSPYDFAWQNASAGTHVITARVIGEDPLEYKNSEQVNILIKEKAETVFRIAEPIKDAVFNSGSNITIKVELPASNLEIERVEYFRDNTRIGSSNNSPYDLTWKNVQQGEYNLIARLVYKDGSHILSVPVKITVLRKNQTMVKLMTKENETEVKSGEELNLEVELVEFEKDVEFVEYFVDGKTIGFSNTASFAFQWRNIPAGNHQLMARAIDANGKSYFSDPIMFRVTNDIRDVQLEYVIGPNPTTDYLNVIFQNLDGIYDFEFRIVSLNGNIQKTFHVRPEDSTVTIDVSDLQVGVYVLNLIGNGNQLSSKKFIKK